MRMRATGGREFLEKATLTCPETIRIMMSGYEAVGEAVLQFWNFPAAISRAVGAHHEPVNGNPLLTILQIADVLESNSLATPLDPQIDSMVDEWKRKLL